MRLSELDDDQRGHLAWRLDHNTATGYLTACAIARGQHGDLDVIEIFKQSGMTPHAAKIHARKVVNFQLSETDRVRLQILKIPSD